MKKTYGKIVKIDANKRIIYLRRRNRIIELYMQRAMFNQFIKYLIVNHYIVAYVKERENPAKPYQKYTISDLIKITKNTRRKTVTLFSHDRLSSQTKQFINTLKNKLFLDLEMSMHPYHFQKDFVQEIIQAGYVLVDENDQVIQKYMAFIKPARHKKLTKRTLKFLDLSQDDVDKGIEFETFYNHFIQLLNDYQPAVIVWGKNDHLALNETAEVNDLPAVSETTRFVNLLNLHKNIFRLKNDLGLLKAYNLYGHESDDQRHDALEDAQMTMKIFNGFKQYLNEKITVDVSELM